MDSGAALGARAAAVGNQAQPQGDSDLKKLVNSLLSHMAPVSGGGSDAATMEAGSYRLDDYVYEQRKRDANAEVAPRAIEQRGAGNKGGDVRSDRLLELLAHQERAARAAGLATTPEKKRESSTALLGSVSQSVGPSENTAVAEAEDGEPAPVEGESSTYKKALAKMQTYEAPTPPPLRAVSGFQGLMKAKPSAQSVEQDRSGTLSALQMKK